MPRLTAASADAQATGTEFVKIKREQIVWPSGDNGMKSAVLLMGAGEDQLLLTRHTAFRSAAQAELAGRGCRCLVPREFARRPGSRLLTPLLATLLKRWQQNGRQQNGRHREKPQTDRAGHKHARVAAT